VNDALAEVIADTNALLFDFDGPLCDVFAGMPAPDVARRLERLAGRSFATDDPLEVMRNCYHTCPRSLAENVESELVRAEVAAVEIALAESRGVDSLRAAHAAGLLIAVVTNNAEEAAARFLELHDLDDLVATIVGRVFRRPDRMKPNPWPLLMAAQILGTAPGRAVLIGDSVTDIEASHSAGMPCVGYANKPGKRRVFEQLGVAAVIDDMGELLSVLRARVRAEDQP
jgi:HAD superfamily hydrolase (TIGR01509 family)